MLICDIEEGGYGLVDNLLFVRPPDTVAAFRLPQWLEPIYEQDGTLTINGPIPHTRRDGSIMNGFLIHGIWHTHEVARVG